MMPSMNVVLAAIVGTLTGSFLNVCIYRLPLRESVVWPGSHCPACTAAIAWYDNIPLLSYGWLLGRCRTCRTVIPFRYPFVELINGVGYAGLVWHYGLKPETLVYATLFSALLVVTGTDVSHKIIPNAVTIPGIVIGVLSAGTLLPLGFVNSLLGMMVGGGILWVLAWLSPLLFGKEGMGGGDIKLMAMVGAVIGWKPVLLAIMIASFVGSLVGIALIAARVLSRHEYLPFGPFLAVGSMIALLLHEPLLKWYWSLFDVLP